jgi:hypothetical protein
MVLYFVIASSMAIRPKIQEAMRLKKPMYDSPGQEIILGSSSKDIAQVEFVGKFQYLLVDLMSFPSVKVLRLSMVFVPEFSRAVGIDKGEHSRSKDTHVFRLGSRYRRVMFNGAVLFL